MNNYKRILIIRIFLSAGLALLPVLSLGAQTRGTLVLEISGARSDSGVVRVLVFSGQKGFPSELDEAVAGVGEVYLKNGRATVRIDNVPAGELAVVIIHDENGNGELDANFIGIPKEGFGLSNNPELKGPPKYEDAAFAFKGGTATVPVTIFYFQKKRGS